MEKILKIRSRKLDLCVFAMFLMAGGYLLSKESPLLQANFPTFVGGINGMYALYVGGNSASKYLYNKKVKDKESSNT